MYVHNMVVDMTAGSTSASAHVFYTSPHINLHTAIRINSQFHARSLGTGSRYCLYQSSRLSHEWMTFRETFCYFPPTLALRFRQKNEPMPTGTPHPSVRSLWLTALKNVSPAKFTFQ